MYIVGMMQPNFKDSRAIIYAPMAGISDSPARRIARKFGADFTFSELISAEGFIRGGRQSINLAKFDYTERPIGLQIFGSNPESMSLAARILAQQNPTFIDINFGCPARKVVDKNGGSSVLKNLELLKEIVDKVISAVKIPVTVKMRAGWDDDSIVHLKAGEIIESCGASAIALHPRTRAQGFSGKADWSLIRELKNAVKIPVIGNGDIAGPEDALRMFNETGCDAVMIGRASIGNPWIFNQIKFYLKNGELLPAPSPRERIEMAFEHLEMLIDEIGIMPAIYKMRTHFCWYMKGLPQISSVRAKLVRLNEANEIRSLLLEYLDKLETIASSEDQELVAG